MNGLMSGMDRRLMMGPQSTQGFAPLDGQTMPEEAPTEAVGPENDPRFSQLTAILGRNIMKDRAQKAAAMQAAAMAQQMTAKQQQQETPIAGNSLTQLAQSIGYRR